MATGAVIARILTQYSDKGSKAAQKDIKKLGAQFDNYAKKATKAFAVAGAAATAYAIKLGKDSVKAAVEDAKSQALLANNLRNTLGATDANIAAVEEYIEKQQFLTNIQDTELRASYGKLAIAIGNTSDAMLVQGVALDVAAGTGKDLTSVTDALVKASQGNFTALKKLVPTIDENIIKNKDFGKALVYMSTTYKGAAKELAKKDPITGLAIVFDDLKEKIGGALLPAFIEFAEYMKNNVVPQIEIFLGMNETRIQSALQNVVGNIKEVVHAFTNIYNVVKSINDVLPFGISGWIQIAVALSVATKAAALYKTGLTVLGIVIMSTNKQLLEAARAAQLAAASSSAADVAGATLAGKLAILIANLRLYITTTYQAKIATLTGKTAMDAATVSTNAFNAALLRVKATLMTAVAFVGKYAKQIGILIAAIAGIGIIWDKILGNNKVKLSDEARKVEYSVYKASQSTKKGTQSMDDALNEYKKTQESVVKKTKEQIAEEKRLAAIKAKALADEKKRAQFEADYAKLNETLAKRAGVRLLSSEDEKMVQINAAIALADRQIVINKLDKERLERLKEEVLLLKVKNDLTMRYADLLQVLADNQITDKEIAVLAAKWGVAMEAVEAYILQFNIVKDGTIDNYEITKLAMSWGSTEAQAAQYLDFLLYLNDSILSDAEIEKLKSKWKLTEDQVRMYADFVGVVNDGKLEDAEIVKLQGKWKLSVDQVVEYIKKIGSPVSYSDTLIDPAKAAEIGWKNATAALLEYLRLLNGGTVPDGGLGLNRNEPPEGVSPSDWNKIIDDVANAAAEAADASVASAEAVAEFQKIMLTGIESSFTRSTMNEFVAAATEIGTSANDIANSMAIGLINQGVKTPEALSTARYTGQALAWAAKYAAENPTVNPDLTLAPGGKSLMATTATDIFDERQSAISDFRSSTMLNAAGITAASTTATPTVVVNVAGSVTSEGDLVANIRNALLAGQQNGYGLTLQAI